MLLSIWILALVSGLGNWVALASPGDVQQHLKKLSATRAQKGKIHLDIAAIAEDGANVLVGFTVKSPMTEEEYVKTVHLFAEENPNPQIISFHFTPLAGKVDVVTKIRLAKSQRVIAVAVMSNGATFIDAKHVKITIGGCGGAN